MTNRLFIFISFGLLFCCSCDQKKDYKVDLLSDDIVKIDKACFELGEAKDTSAVRLLLNHLKDPRITNNLNFKGRPTGRKACQPSSNESRSITP